MSNTSSYLRRIVDDEIDQLFPHLPAIAIEGVRGSGKTTTAKQRAKTVFALDLPGQREILLSSPEQLLTAERPVLIDEWQYVPECWDLVRRAVDDGAPPGSFLFTGSRSPAGLGTHSGAGRIVVVRMRPMSLTERFPEPASASLAALLSGSKPAITGSTERSLSDYVAEILRSGLPGIRDLPDVARQSQLDSYLARIVDRDFPDLGRVVRNPAGLRRWMTAYAAATSTSASFETIRDAATAGEHDKPAKTTVMPYRDVLERLWVIDPVHAWKPTRSRISRLSLPPKHHLADPAFATSLLNLDADALLSGIDSGPPVPRHGTLLGSLFESLVTLSVKSYAETAKAYVGHLRTHGGAREVDLIVERRDGPVVAIEVKLKQTVDDDDVRHLRWLAEQIGEELLDAVIVTTGPRAYRRRDGIAVVPAALLGP